jgi:hypothetical protein
MPPASYIIHASDARTRTVDCKGSWVLKAHFGRLAALLVTVTHHDTAAGRGYFGDVTYRLSFRSANVLDRVKDLSSKRSSHPRCAKWDISA